MGRGRSHLQVAAWSLFWETPPRMDCFACECSFRLYQIGVSGRTYLLCILLFSSPGSIRRGQIDHLFFPNSRSLVHSCQIDLFHCYSFLCLVEARCCGFGDEKHFKNLSDNHGTMVMQKSSSFSLKYLKPYSGNVKPFYS